MAFRINYVDVNCSEGLYKIQYLVIKKKGHLERFMTDVRPGGDPNKCYFHESIDFKNTDMVLVAIKRVGDEPKYVERRKRRSRNKR